MSTGQAKEDNLVQLKTNDNNSDTIRVNNKINTLEKSLNDVQAELKKSSGDLKKQIIAVTNKDQDLESNVAHTLSKIIEVEAEISQLYKDIDNTNLSVTENVQKIESKHTDLSSKVSETYKQLGSVEKAYSALKLKSAKITKDIKDITVQVETVSDEIRQQIITIESKASSLENHIDSVEVQSTESAKQLTQGQEELIERTNSIVKEAKKTAIALEKSITDNAALMTSIETKLITEIESLAKSTDEKTADLANDIEKADKEIQSHSAKMLKLQSVDQALEKRAEKLEDTAKSLTAETKTLFKATTTLGQRSTALEDSVETLGIQIYRIEQENEIQQAQLDLLREKTSATNKTLAALSKLVSVNFITTGAFITLLVVSVIGLYIYQNDLWTTDATTTAQRTDQINQTITGLTDHVNTTDNQAANRISQLETQVIALNQQLKTVNDKNVSLDNRLVNIAPHRKIGNDNILHSLQWISQQPDSNFAIRALSASSEEEIFELAVRYNHSLKDVLSFKTDIVNGESLHILFMGSYSDKAEAELALKSLPFRLNGETPELTTYAQMK